MKKTYAIKEVFWTLQGEGSRAGTAAVFVRFAGCNLWNGLPEGRAKGAGECARWCDTDFYGGEKLTEARLVARMEQAWQGGDGGIPNRKWCVLTGGEPLLQVDEALCRTLKAAGWCIAVETNGTQEVAPLFLGQWVDHVTCSPKIIQESRKIPLLLDRCTDLKVVVPGTSVPGAGWSEASLRDVAKRVRHEYAFVQPCDPVLPATVGLTHLTLGNRNEVFPKDFLAAAAWQEAARVRYTEALRFCIDFVRRNPSWRLGTQAHKHWELP